MNDTLTRYVLTENLYPVYIESQNLEETIDTADWDWISLPKANPRLAALLKYPRKVFLDGVELDISKIEFNGEEVVFYLGSKFYRS